MTDEQFQNIMGAIAGLAARVEKLEQGGEQPEAALQRHLEELHANLPDLAPYRTVLFTGGLSSELDDAYRFLTLCCQVSGRAVATALYPAGEPSYKLARELEADPDYARKWAANGGPACHAAADLVPDRVKDDFDAVVIIRRVDSSYVKWTMVVGSRETEGQVLLSRALEP